MKVACTDHRKLVGSLAQRKAPWLALLLTQELVESLLEVFERQLNWSAKPVAARLEAKLALVMVEVAVARPL